jgi:hypothetical protein
MAFIGKFVEHLESTNSPNTNIILIWIKFPVSQLQVWLTAAVSKLAHLCTLNQAYTLFGHIQVSICARVVLNNTYS